MKVTYQPEGADPRIWMFRPGKLMNVEAEEIERVTRMDFSDWVAKLPPAKVNATALHGLLYVLLKREIPTLKYDEVTFATDELEFELELDEKQDAVKRLKEAIAAGQVKAEDLEDINDALAALEKEIADEVGDVPAEDVAEAPKAASIFADDGSGTSPTTSTSTRLTSIG